MICLSSGDCGARGGGKLHPVALKLLKFNILIGDFKRGSVSNFHHI